MKVRSRALLSGLVVAASAVGTAAWAQGWSSFDSAFTTQPCHDGWLGCVVGGAELSPDMAADESGRKTPTDMRVGWFDLQATDSFSPFVGLSEYSVDAAAAAVADAGGNDEPPDAGGTVVAPPSAPAGRSQEREQARAADEAAERAALEAMAQQAASAEAAERARNAERARAEAEAEARRQRERESQMAAAAAAAARDAEVAEVAQRQRMQQQAAAAAAAASAAEAERAAADEAARQAAAEEARQQQVAAQEAQLQAEAEAARLQAEAEARAAAEQARVAAAEERARSEAEAALRAADAERAAAEAASAAEAERIASAQRAAADQAETGETDAGNDALAAAAMPSPPSVVDDGSCSDVLGLEPTAMLGKLTEAQMTCLEASLAAVTKMTDKEKVSLVLMINAYAKGDKKSWESLVRRHLDEIDQSDPNVCYKYAVHLSRMGSGRASGVIRWANVALDNRTVWTGDTYTSRVYSLYKLRAAASQDLWRKSEEDHAAAPTDETSSKVEKYRALTKVNAREWLEYAKDSGKDASKAAALCMSAAGTADYCEAG